MLATILCAMPDGRRTTRRLAAWDALQRRIRTEVERFGGGSIDRIGGSVVAVFDGPARAIRCARAINAAHRGVPIRIGVHTGECDLVGGVACGLAVEISNRIAELAEPGAVLVSRTVVDLVAGSGLHFSARGTYRLANGLYKWQVYAVAHDENCEVPNPGSLSSAC